MPFMLTFMVGIAILILGIISSTFCYAAASDLDELWISDFNEKLSNFNEKFSNYDTKLSNIISSLREKGVYYPPSDFSSTSYRDYRSSTSFRWSHFREVIYWFAVLGLSSAGKYIISNLVGIFFLPRTLVHYTSYFHKF